MNVLRFLHPLFFFHLPQIRRPLLTPLFALLLLTGCGESQGQQAPDPEDYGYTEFHLEENLKGPIRELSLQSYSADKDFNKLAPKHKYSWQRDYVRNFSFDGTLIVDHRKTGEGEDFGDRVQRFRPDGVRLVDSSANKYVLYEYNADDFLIFEGNSFAHERHAYEGNNLLATYYVEDGDTTGIGHYLSVGDTIYQLALEGTDTVGVNISVENSFQLPVYERMAMRDGYEELTVTDYGDNELQKVKETWQTIEDGVVTGTVTHEYSDGDEVRTVEREADGSVHFEENITYTYDEYLNWVEQRINYNNERYYLVIRKISYY